jgi:hypothetical protein
MHGVRVRQLLLFYTFLVDPKKNLTSINFCCISFEQIVQLRKTVKLNGKAHLKSWLPRRTLDVIIL